MAGEHAEIEAVVGAYFADPSPPSEEFLWGPTLEWAKLRGRPVDEFQRTRDVRRVEVLEVRGNIATASLDVLEHARHPRGVREHRFRFSGPVVLEQVAGRWRIVDWAFEGRRRLESLVVGVLAEQKQGDVAVRVVGVDRLAVGTRAIVELENRSEASLVVHRSFVRRGRRWHPAWTVPADPISPGARVRREIGTNRAYPVSAPLELALDVRPGERRLSFVLPVPAEPVAEPLRPPPPARLPGAVWAPFGLSLALSAIGLGAVAWFADWPVLVVPIVLGLSWRRALLRATRPWVRQLRPWLAAVWTACVGLAAWKLPVAAYAVPAVVALIVWALVRRAGPRGRHWSAALAVAAGIAWFYFLGSGSRPLSPCRLLGRDEGRAADAFARAWLAGDARVAGHWAKRGFRDLSNDNPFPRDEADRIVAARPPSRACPDGWPGVACFTYPLPGVPESSTLTLSVDCDGVDWRVAAFS